MFVRFICLMGGSAGNREYSLLPPGIAAVLAYKYGSLLMELFGGILGAADKLHDEFGVEVQHILQVPEVGAGGCELWQTMCATSNASMAVRTAAAHRSLQGHVQPCCQGNVCMCSAWRDIVPVRRNCKLSVA